MLFGKVSAKKSGKFFSLSLNCGKNKGIEE